MSVRVSLNRYETPSLEDQLLKVNTPRSLEAIRRAGALPSDLVHVPFDDFRARERESISKSGHRKNVGGEGDKEAADEDILQMRY